MTEDVYYFGSPDWSKAKILSVTLWTEDGPIDVDFDDEGRPSVKDMTLTFTEDGRIRLDYSTTEEKPTDA